MAVQVPAVCRQPATSIVPYPAGRALSQLVGMAFWWAATLAVLPSRLMELMREAALAAVVQSC